MWGGGEVECWEDGNSNVKSYLEVNIKIGIKNKDKNKDK